MNVFRKDPVVSMRELCNAHDENRFAIKFKRGSR